MRYAWGLLFAILAFPFFASAQSVCQPLSIGSTGAPVTALQQFLFNQYQGFPSPTGYFGTVTQAAVKQWQTEHSIVSSGRAATTGWGVVGPKTRAAMGLSCASSSSSNTVSSTQASTKQSLLNALLSELKALQQEIAALTSSTSVPITIPLSTGGGGSSGGSGPGGGGGGGGNSPLASCAQNGTILQSGSSQTFYSSPSVSFGSVCSAVSQSRTCTNGTLSGDSSYQFASCSVGHANACSFNSQSIASGASVTAYQSSSVPAGSQCVSAQLTCTNGTLSGVQNYPYASCAVTSYPVMPNPPQTQVINSYDAYSPEPVDWNGGIRLYFGGWYTAADSPNDSIFVADCPSSGGPCSNVRKVIDPVATGWYQLNDPSILLHPATASSPAYYIMYMTCDTSPSPASNGICYSTSWVNDGINWSTPTLLTNSYWLPSATWKNDHVELWANEISPGRVAMFNLGGSGTALGNPTVVQYDNTSAIPPLYDNVDVGWRPSLGMYQILAERSVGGTASSPSVIDYLSSTDGVNWHLQYPAVISAQPGQFRVGTPGQNPDTAAYVYFGVTALTDSEGFSIDFAQWNPPN